MSAKRKTEVLEIDDNVIIEKYMDSVLSGGDHLKNVYTFCKHHEIEESTFYSFFGSLDGIKSAIWIKLFENAETALYNDPQYENYDAKTKLLSLFYTLFEVFALNRSYLLETVKKEQYRLKDLEQLKGFRKRFKTFVDGIQAYDNQSIPDRIRKTAKPLYSEGAWIQFLLLFRYWLSDESPKAQKTDILIEKSVNAATDLLDIKPIESLFDLGKFLWKEGNMR